METVIRVVLIYLVILAGLRLLGKREFGELSPLELITLLLIPELVAQALLRKDFSVTNAMIAVTTLFSLVFMTSALRYLSSTVDKVLSGDPTVLVSHGEFVVKNMNKERVGPPEIYGEMHKAGLYRLDQVKWAILESDGEISFLPENPNTAVELRKTENSSTT